MCVLWALWEEMSQCWVDTLCPQVSILGDQEGRQEGHMVDGKGHLTDWVTKLHSFSRCGSFVCLLKPQIAGFGTSGPGCPQALSGEEQGRGPGGTGRLCWEGVIWVKSLCPRLNDEVTSYGSRTSLEPGSPKPSAGLLSDNLRNG